MYSVSDLQGAVEKKRFLIIAWNFKRNFLPTHLVILYARNSFIQYNMHAHCKVSNITTMPSSNFSVLENVPDITQHA